jgi:hypothetical protein
MDIKTINSFIKKNSLNIGFKFKNKVSSPLLFIEPKSPIYNNRYIKNIKYLSANRLKGRKIIRIFIYKRKNRWSNFVFYQELFYKPIDYKEALKTIEEKLINYQLRLI